MLGETDLRPPRTRAQIHKNSTLSDNFRSMAACSSQEQPGGTVETGQIFSVEISTADICPVSTEDIFPVSTESITAAGRRPATVASSVETG